MAQTFIIYGDKCFGGNLEEHSTKILLDAESNLIIAGESRTNISGDKLDPNCDTNAQTTDLWILKTDTAFNIIFWQNDIGGSSIEGHSMFNSASNPGQTLFSCMSYSDNSCDKSNNNWSQPGDFWIGQLDTNGVLIWDRTLGGFGNEANPQMTQLTNGNYIICGASASGADGDKTVINYGGVDMWCVMIDSLQNKIWDNVYGGSSAEHPENDAFDLIKDFNGSFIFAIAVEGPISGSISDSSRGFHDIWVVKIDSLGNKIWDRRYGGDGVDMPNKIIATNDEGYLIGGTTRSQMGLDVSEPPLGGVLNDFWIIKIDSLGNKQWDKRYGGSLAEEDVWLEQDFDGGYLIAGTTFSDSGYFISEPAYGSRDYWILKIDSVGNKIWDKRFGGSGYNSLSNFVLLADTSIVLFGSADSNLSAVKTDPGNGNIDYWLVRFRYQDNSTGLSEYDGHNNLATVYPNPTMGEITINPKGAFKPDEFYLFDVTGRVVFFDELDNLAIDIGRFQSALYFYEVRNRDGIRVFGKLLKQ